VTVSNTGVGLSATVLYLLAFSLSLGISLAEYFGSESLAR
jgi:hypothetical protein